MRRVKADRVEERAQAAFRAAQARWRNALEAHRRAPPDAGFSARLAAVSAAATAEAEACREAEAAGFDWSPHRATASAPPYELRPDSGRRGPEEGWRRFDAAAAHLSRAAAATDLLAVADAYAELGEAAGELAQTVQREERAACSSAHARGDLRSRFRGSKVGRRGRQRAERAARAALAPRDRMARVQVSDEIRAAYRASPRATPVSVALGELVRREVVRNARRSASDLEGVRIALEDARQLSDEVRY
jgi:hypothetical protein